MIAMFSLFLKAHCHKTESIIECEATHFWTKGFVAFQAAINAAIIEALLGRALRWLCLHSGPLLGDYHKVRPICHLA